MPWATTADRNEIYYEDHGSGPTLVFVSGYFGISDIWRDQLSALSDTFRCIALDNRGYGRSDKPLPNAAASIEQHAADLQCVLDAAGVVAPFGMVTHSMGGNIASTYCLANPGSVVGIAYTGTYVSGQQLQRLGQTLQEFQTRLRTPGDRVGFFSAFGLPDALALEAAKWPLYAMLGNAYALFQCDLDVRHAEIDVPTVVIQGGSDVVTPVDPCATELVAALPNARLEVLEGVNHFPCVEAPEVTTRLIADHFSFDFGDLSTG